MIAFEDAKKKAQDIMKDMGLKSGSVMDDGEFYIFGYSEEVDISPIGVNKNTGEVIDYFPPEHPKFANATEI